jgi:class 3 adenylate cyclase/tetratricopeptide (TPR) repeat protein
MDPGVVVCSNCGRGSATDASFCAGCGASLERSAPGLLEERKVVTILFADLVGSTTRAEASDPEDVRATLSAYYTRLRAELERHGGTVEKFIGDAVMAVFGAPVAHEDDPERAVRAALAIRDALADSDVDVRVAVHTGEALVSRGARVAAGEAMVAGDVVNTAARLQSGAPVNGVLVGETTYRATEHAIRYGAVASVHAKGKSEPVPAWEALEAKARFGVDVESETLVGLVGRQEEVALLAGALDRVRREREPQLVTLVGVPGIGKSRLVTELLAVVDALPDLITWRQGRCLPYGDGVSFWALGEMTKAQAGVLDTDSSQVAENKLADAVAVLLPEPAEAAWVLGHLRPLLGLGGASGADDRRSEAFAAWRRFFEALAEQRPSVLVFEDLHWADDGLLDFVDHLVEWAREVPLLVVATARPELLERRPGWGGGKANAATISLRPLSDDQTGRLLGLLLGRSVIDAGVQSELLARAGGNPLYAEEYVRMLRDGRFAGDRLPETVQGIIAARLDALPAEEKLLLQDAAVIGKVFWSGALGSLGGVAQETAEERLHALERKEFVRRERRGSIVGDTEYAFRHLLVRDVAYAQIPRLARADKHRLAAEWIESLAGDRAEDRSELLAHHYGTALELARAAGSEETSALEERARRAFVEGGERALSLSALPTAVRFFARALELTPEEDPGWPALVLRHGRVGFDIRQAGEQPLVARALERMLADGDVERAVDAEVLLAECDWFAGRSDSTFDRLTRARELVAGRPASPSKTHALAQTSRFLMLANRTEEAVEVGRESLALAEELDLRELQAHALNNIGTARVAHGDLEGFTDLERSASIAREINSPEELRSLGNLASLVADIGDLGRAHELYEQVVEGAGRFGVVGFVGWCAAELSLLDFYAGRWDAALDGADAFFASLGEGHYMEPLARQVISEIADGRGDTERAIAESDRAVAFARSAKDPQVVYPALASNARTLARAGRASAADERIRELLALVAARAFQANRWALDLTFALEDLGRPADATAVLAGLRTGTRWHDAASAYAAGDRVGAAVILAAMGDATDEAYARLRAAELGGEHGQLGGVLAFYRAVGASAYLRRAEKLLPASA